ncbi:MAG: ACT domain-containing protein [Candidatus Peribacteria bacterium]|jgi:hypothetical protein|nr:ACT domain-containing protein [Candidatus Peribacteria bacterium]
MQLYPRLNEGIYCFVSLPIGDTSPKEALLTFQEQEGTTIIIEKTLAKQYGYIYAFPSAWITLTTETGLTMTGITATFSKILSDNAISCNVVAAFHHDHIFVPVDKKDQAIMLLKSIHIDM